MRRAAIAVLVLLLGVLAMACGEATSNGGGDPAAPGDPNPPVSSSPDPGGGTGELEAQRVMAQDGLVDVGAHRYEKVEVIDSGEALDIYFWDGIEECGGVDHARLTYEAERITVNLFTGRNPEVEVCTEQAVYKVFQIELAEPLEGRKLVDGAR
ncbi:MAG: hypothetical protein ACRDJL_03270 [Actinomycetota bacterium]